MRDSPRHVPVLVAEVVAGLVCAPGGVFIDGTVGEGGHAAAILRATAPDGRVIGIDQDAEALASARQHLEGFGDRVTLVHDSFFHLSGVAERLGIREVDGILLDLGVSSLQLDRGELGFSFSVDGPLDMRMDPRSEVQASDLVNRLTAAELEHLLKTYGEERWARRIARSLVREREKRPILRTRHLAEVVTLAVPTPSRYGARHPATRTFQALRIAVNRELEGLDPAVRAGVDLLKPGGRIGVISFHSLEDRIIKDLYRDLSRGCVCPRTFPVCICRRTPVLRPVTRKPMIPTEEEIQKNPRSRSAKLRIAEKLPPTGGGESVRSEVEGGGRG
ncbi:MAG: 16S rRNA (cytosine(1402)-N(4))-methyltransferase RsmH [Nitrospirae bacterium]|nr:16S rRNA (cytosine(1402)-N(4))-methyltransferase RsmH [Nitrospirota bacterium]